MKDLDFDELDKAVNSLMTSLPKTAPPPNTPEEDKTLNITSTISEEEPISFDKLDAAAADAMSAASPAEEQKSEVVAATVASMPTPTPSPTAPSTSRRGGRFMDVVHPSSDMKKATQPTRAVSRQGSTIEPTVPVRSDAPRASTPFASPSSVETSEAKKPISSPTVDDADSSGNWPDPLEMTDFKDGLVPKEEDWSASSPDSKSAEQTTESSPLTSPFLPDTKVEKRPLGSGAFNEESESVIEPAEPREDKTVDDPDDQLPPMPADASSQLPEELQSDLMSVEADTHMGMPKTEPAHPLDEKMLESGLPQEPTTKSVPLASPAGSVSIPQQYHEEPSTGDQKSGGIYDTDSYHRPLEHPAKKKSGWMWIIWIVIILLVGAGAGAALYFSGLV